jgi:uridine kinase
MPVTDYSEQFKSWLRARVISCAAPFILGVSGGSGSGKTTLAEMIHSLAGHELSTLLYQDSYYIDQSAKFDRDGGSVNFDHPSSIEFSLLAMHLGRLRMGREIKMPIYDFSQHKRIDRTVNVEPKALMIVDGILILNDFEVRSQLDLSVFVTCSEAVRFERRLERDTHERGRTPEGVRTQWNAQVKPMHDEFVEPSRKHAGIVVNGEEWVIKGLDQVIRGIMSQ